MANKRSLKIGKKRPGRQVAALPLIVQDGATMVMLVTSRETQRWVLPKGWAETGLAPHDVAAKEAFEEAGLVGEVTQKAVGEYTYGKRLEDGQTVQCKVMVYPFQVSHQLETWPERHQRQTRWFSLSEAAQLVEEEELMALLQRLAAP